MLGYNELEIEPMEETQKNLQWKASQDRVIVAKAAATGEQKRGAIVLPEKTSLTIGLGTVLAVGPDAHGLQPGDSVFYSIKGAFEFIDGIVSVHADNVFGAQRETNE